ncbi:MAG: hypothetical protein ABIF10_07975 [Candidatus Woesearchaeota archaeon]
MRYEIDRNSISGRLSGLYLLTEAHPDRKVLQQIKSGCEYSGPIPLREIFGKCSGWLEKVITECTVDTYIKWVFDGCVPAVFFLPKLAGNDPYIRDLVPRKGLSFDSK